MLTHPLENLDPAQSVQVLPRHLAGPGAVDPRAAWAFPVEEGWPFAQTEAGTAAAFSPCLRLQTTFDPQPDKPGTGTWTINAHRAPFTSPSAASPHGPHRVLCHPGRASSSVGAAPGVSALLVGGDS